MQNDSDAERQWCRSPAMQSVSDAKTLQGLRFAATKWKTKYIH